MKIIEQKMRCAVCGHESEYSIIASMYSMGYSDFDFKPEYPSFNRGRSVMECENCHYSNYDISECVDPRFKNKLGLWNQDSTIKYYMEKFDKTLRKFLIAGYMYESIGDYEKKFDLLMLAAWVSEDNAMLLEDPNKKPEDVINKYGMEHDKEFYKAQAIQLKKDAIMVYIEKILPKYQRRIMQIGDTLRQLEDFKDAESYFEVIKLIAEDNPKRENEYKETLKIIDAENEFIKNKDSKRHNLGEIFDQNN